MALTFVIGRAGSGKTRFSYERIRDIIRAGETRAAYLLVPEQMTYRADVELVSEPGIVGFSRTQVVSFKRLNQLVAGAVGRPLRRTLTGVERAVLIRRILIEQEPDLRFFGKSADKGGFIEELAALFSEMKQSQIAPEWLISAESEGSGFALEKTGEVARLFALYQEFLAAQRLRDADDYAVELATALSENPRVFAGADFYVDSFASFTPAETVVLKAILGQADSVYVNVLSDPNEARKCLSGTSVDERSHFAPTLKAMLGLKAMAEGAGIRVNPSMFLPRESRTLPRFLQGMARVESGLFSESQQGVEDVDDALNVLTFADVTGEAAGIAHQIQLLVKRRGYRYGEIAVLARDLGAYRTVLKAAFDEAGVPYFLDERDALAMTPLVRALKAAVDAVESGFTQESVIAYMKASAGVERHDAVCRLENYAFAHGTMFGRWLKPIKAEVKSLLVEKGEMDEAAAAELEETRRVVMSPLVKLRDETRGAKRYDAFARALIGLVEEIAGRWSESEAGDETIDALLAAVAGITRTLGDVTSTFEEFAKVLDAAVEASSVGRVPMALDAVNIGEVERSRLPDVRAVFVIGMTERSFPRSFIENEILSDDEREAVNDALKVSLPLKRATLSGEKLLFYIAVTRARERVWLTRPMTDAKGSPLNPSVFLTDLGLEPRDTVDMKETSADGEGEPWLAGCASVDEVRKALVERSAACAYGLSPEIDDDACAVHNSLIRAADESYSRMTEAFAPEMRARVAPELVAPLLGDAPTFSVTELEDYAMCPFKYFAGHLIQLRERAVLEATTIREGIIVHRVLEHFYAAVPRGASGGRSLKGIDEDQVGALLDGALDEVRGEIGAHVFEDDPRMVFLWDRLAARIRWFIADEREWAETSKYVPWAFEVSFRGMPRRLPKAPQELRPVERLEIADKSGRTALLKGKIDRIDIDPEDGTAVVVDYKLSPRGPNRIARFVAGIDLQLPVYAIAVNEVWKKSCVAGFYVAVADRVKSQKNSAGRRRGFYLLGRSYGSEKSPIPKRAYRPDGIDEAGLGDALSQVKDAVLGYVESIESGVFTVWPLQDGNYLACDLCPYAEVCRVDPRTTSVRMFRPPKPNAADAGEAK